MANEKEKLGEAAQKAAQKVKNVVTNLQADDVRKTVTDMTENANAFVDEAVTIIDNMQKVFGDIDTKIAKAVKNDSVRMYAMPALLIGAGIYWLLRNQHSK